MFCLYSALVSVYFETMLSRIGIIQGDQLRKLIYLLFLTIVEIILTIQRMYSVISTRFSWYCFIIAYLMPTSQVAQGRPDYVFLGSGAWFNSLLLPSLGKTTDILTVLYIWSLHNLVGSLVQRGFYKFKVVSWWETKVLLP